MLQNLQPAGPGFLGPNETSVALFTGSSLEHKMRFLICGLGSIGQRHLQNLLSLGEDDIVLYRTGKATLASKEFARFPVEDDLSRVVETWKPQAAIISNPTSLHMDTALPLARAGIHLLIEKPISNSRVKVLDLQETLHESGAKVLVGYQFRFHPGIRQAKKMIAEGAIGKIDSVHVYWGEYLPDWHPWEDYQLAYSARRDLGGGVVLTLSHPIDYLRWIFGEVDALTAEIGNRSTLAIDVEESADFELAFNSGVKASVHLDYLQNPKRHWMDIKGEHGTLHWDYADADVRWSTSSTQDERRTAGTLAFQRNEMFLQEMAHFIDLIRDDGNPICTVEDGLRTLEVALAVHQSARERRKIVMKELEGARL